MARIWLSQQAGRKGNGLQAGKRVFRVNHKAMLAAPGRYNDRDYYFEFTYNGNLNETYMDVYTKDKNVLFKEARDGATAALINKAGKRKSTRLYKSRYLVFDAKDESKYEI